MQDDARIIDKLNELLADKMTAIKGYIAHSEMCDKLRDDWRHHLDEKLIVEEMKHAEVLIAHIISRQGRPRVSRLNKAPRFMDVAAQHHHFIRSEDTSIQAYAAVIALAIELGDHETRRLLEAILRDEERHLDWLEMPRYQRGRMVFRDCLVEQLN